MNESIEVKGAVVQITYTLADKLDTKFSTNTVTITIAPAKDGCTVKMKMEQKVDSRIVLSAVLRRSQKQSTSAVEEYLSKHLK